MSERPPYFEVRFFTVLDLGVLRALMWFSPGCEGAATPAPMPGRRPLGRERLPAAVLLPLPAFSAPAAPSWSLPPTFSHTRGLLPKSPSAHTQEFVRVARRHARHRR